MCKKDWTYEEDEIISKDCEDCDSHFEGSDIEDLGVCPDCGSKNLINSTSHEGVDCAICDKPLDIFENGYRNEKDSDKLICEDCYEELEDCSICGEPLDITNNKYKHLKDSDKLVCEECYKELEEESEEE